MITYDIHPNESGAMIHFSPKCFYQYTLICRMCHMWILTPLETIGIILTLLYMQCGIATSRSIVNSIDNSHVAMVSNTNFWKEERVLDSIRTIAFFQSRSHYILLLHKAAQEANIFYEHACQGNRLLIAHVSKWLLVSTLKLSWEIEYRSHLRSDTAPAFTLKQDPKRQFPNL